MEVMSLVTSVSLPGTIVIWTQMSAFAALKLSTIFLRASESGGVWLVQNLTTVAFAAQLAPVKADGAALAPAAVDALAPVDAAALAAVPGLACGVLHAPTRSIAA